MMSCDLHDYIEVACMYNYTVKLTFKSGSIIECKALDTQRNENREECMKVKIEGVESLVVLDNILRMEASVQNPHFQVVNFA